MSVLDALRALGKLQKFEDAGFDTSKLWFHGSTHDVPWFDLGRINSDNYAGSFPHLTDSAEDASFNYAGMYGPDNRLRAQVLSEQLADDYGAYNLHGAERAQALWRAQEQAKRILFGEATEGVVYPLLHRMQNPARLGGSAGRSYLDVGGNFDNIANTLDDINASTGGYNWKSSGPIMDRMSLKGLAYDDIPADTFWKELRSDPHISSAQGAGGKLITGDVLARIMQTFGHDGLILDAGRTFPRMHATSNAQHAIPFDPAMLRSIFAKLDPAKRDSADLLAGISGGAIPVGILAELDRRRSMS